MQLLIHPNGGVEQKTPINEVIKPSQANHKTFNKYVRDLQESISIDTEGKVTGTLKYVEGYETGSVTEGNFIHIHVDNAKLTSENVKMGYEGNLLEPDKNDWNYVFLVDEERKAKKLQLEVDGKVEYTLDLSGVTLNSK